MELASIAPNVAEKSRKLRTEILAIGSSNTQASVHLSEDHFGGVMGMEARMQ